MVNQLLDLLNPIGPPCPNLGTNVVHDGDAQLLGSSRYEEIEVWKIDQDQKGRTDTSQISLCLSESLEKPIDFVNPSQ